MLSIVLPTYNEAKNLPELLDCIADVLEKRAYEVIVVDDDSPDRTWEVADSLQKTHSMLRVIRRVGRRGLSSAVVEGFDAAKGDVLLVMDSDLQHDSSLILQLSDAITKGADIAVASRYMKGGSVGEWVRGRRLLSNTATWLAKSIPAVHVSDPMSGFFAIKRSTYEGIRPMLRPAGFKILFEILGHLPRRTTTAEVPLVFQMRKHGESKLSVTVELQFIVQLLRIALIRLQKILFWSVCITIALILFVRLMPLLPLYTNPIARSQVQHTLQFVAAQNGWLLSDISLRSVGMKRMTVLHREHRFGPDPVPVCYDIEYVDLVLRKTSCGD